MVAVNPDHFGKYGVSRWYWTIDARRRELVDVAHELFIERGYHATSVSETTERAGIAQGAFYRYFPSKRELLDDLVDRTIQQLLDIVLADPPEAAGSLDTLRDVLSGIGERLMEFFAREPGLVRAVLVEIGTIDDEMNARALGLLETGAALAVGYLDNGVRAGYLKPDLNTHAIARTLFGLVGGGLPTATRDQDTDTAIAEASEYMRAAVEMVIDGIRAT